MTALHTEEQLFHTRRWILSWSLMSFTLWQGADLVGNIIGTTPILSGISIIGALLWMVPMLSLYRYFRRIKHLRLRAVLNDDLHQDSVLRSISTAYVVLTAAIALLFCIASFINVDGLIIAQALLIITVTSPILAYMVFDRTMMTKAENSHDG